jgi:hypothetical protein
MSQCLTPVSADRTPTADVADVTATLGSGSPGSVSR